MNSDIRKVGQVTQELMSDFDCNCVPFDNRQFGTYGKIDFGVQTMT